VIDHEGEVRYHGRIDDQFAERRKRNVNPTANDLKDALSALLSGKDVADGNSSRPSDAHA